MLYKRPPNATIKAFCKLLTDSGSVLNVKEKVGIYNYKDDIDFLFDLDVLWSKHLFFDRLNKLLISLSKDLPRDLDLIGGITSNVGSFGTVPIASALALKLKKDLVTFEEMDFGQYYVTPLSKKKKELFEDKNILLIKDVIMGGRSLKQIGSLISESGGHISAILCFVDFGINEKLEVDGTSDNTLFLRVLVGPRFNECKMRNSDER